MQLDFVSTPPTFLNKIAGSRHILSRDPQLLGRDLRLMRARGVEVCQLSRDQNSTAATACSSSLLFPAWQ